MTSWDLIPAGINRLTQWITEVILVNNLNNLNWHKVQRNMQPTYPFRFIFCPFHFASKFQPCYAIFRHTEFPKPGQFFPTSFTWWRTLHLPKHHPRWTSSGSPLPLSTFFPTGIDGFLWSSSVSTRILPY